MSLRPRPPPAAPAGSRLEAVLRVGHVLRAANVGVKEDSTLRGLKRNLEQEPKAEEKKVDPEAENAAVAEASKVLGFTFDSRSPHSVFTLHNSTPTTIAGDRGYRMILGNLVRQLVEGITRQYNLVSYRSRPGDFTFPEKGELGSVMAARAQDLYAFDQILGQDISPINVWSAGRLLLRNLELGGEFASLAHFARKKMDEAAANAGFAVEDEVYVYTGVCAEKMLYAEWDDADPVYRDGCCAESD